MDIYLVVLLNSDMAFLIYNLNNNTEKLLFWKREIQNIEKDLMLGLEIQNF